MKSVELKIPQNFLKISENLNLVVIKCLIFNKRKDTATFVVKQNEKKYILKCVGEDAPPIEKKRFDNEISYYKSPKSISLKPALILSGTNYLLIEYVEAQTLRKRLEELMKSKDYNENSLLIFLQNQTFQILNEYEKIIEFSEVKEISKTSASQTFISIYSKMALSGPFSTRRTKIENYVSAFYLKLTQGMVRKAFTQLLTEDYTLNKFGPTHGDLHLENILTSCNAEKVCIIDFANSKPNGYIFSDIIYCLSAIFTLIEPRQELKKQFINVLLNYSSQSKIPLKNLIKSSIIISKVGVLNRRFNPQSSNTSIFKSYVLFLFHLNKELRE